MKNQKKSLIDTIGAFLHKDSAYGGSLNSDSCRLYSYLIVIGEWDGDVIRLLKVNKGYCRTTDRHCGMLRAMATAQGIQIIEA